MFGCFFVVVFFMSIYTVCNFSACEIIKYSDSDSDSDSEIKVDPLYFKITAFISLYHYMQDVRGDCSECCL